MKGSRIKMPVWYPGITCREKVRDPGALLGQVLVGNPNRTSLAIGSASNSIVVQNIPFGMHR